MKLTLFVPLAVLSVVAVGCGSSSTDNAATPPPPVKTAGATPPAATAPTAAPTDAGATPAASGPGFKNVVLTDEPTAMTAKDSFPRDTPKITIFFDMDGEAPTDKTRGVLIFEHGNGAPDNTKVFDVPLEAKGDTGKFAFSKPTKGWPDGSYHVDLYVNDAVKQTVKFTVTPK